MIKNYKVDFSGSKQPEIQLIKTVGNYNTWRVYFDIFEHEDERETQTVEVPKVVVEHIVEENPETGEAFEYDIERTVMEEKEITTEVWEAKYVEVTKNRSEEVTPLGLVQELMIQEISDYDVSEDVNSFVMNGAPVWLDKDTRVGLMNSTSISKAVGHENTTLWLGTFCFEINCDTCIQLLGALELYALQCFNKTAEHKKNILDLQTVEEVVKYDYKTGYPEKLSLNV